MKLIVLFALIGLCVAKPADLSEADATVFDDPSGRNYADFLNPTGYDYTFKTSNNIERSEVADLEKNIVTGEYSYISPEGQTIRVTYTAGAGIGFNPKSEIIPDAIQEAVELNLKNPPEEPSA